jgi:CDP-diacylglycerol--serine O-phosphatidyltransferase
LLNSRRRPRKWSKGIPHAFTLGNAFFGFCAIAHGFSGDIVIGAHLIFVGALLDLVDGGIARRMGLSSDFGTQLDSLCDAITFCLAPAFLCYVAYLEVYGWLGIFVSSFFLLAGLLRLARFNVVPSASPTYFKGIPTTMAGGMLASLLLNAPLGFADEMFACVVILFLVVLSFLMVCPIRFPSSKRRLPFALKRWHIASLAAMIFAIVVILRVDQIIFLFFFSYIVVALLFAMWRLFA